MSAKGIGMMVATVLAWHAGAGWAASMDDKASKEVLAAMGRTSTWGHPDEDGEFRGMQYYADKRYDKAMENFLEGARYADKLSQLSIGLMYLNGEGVEKDPARACAWFALAAERKYPAYVATRERVWRTLDDTQRARATALLEQLMPEYGDAVAKVRMERVLRQTRSTMTGSLVGYGDSRTASMTPAQIAASEGGVAAAKWYGGFPACGARTIDAGPITGCGNLFVEWRWNPKEYFRVRDAVWFGTVKVGATEKVDGG